MSAENSQNPFVIFKLPDLRAQYYNPNTKNSRARTMVGEELSQHAYDYVGTLLLGNEREAHTHVIQPATTEDWTYLEGEDPVLYNQLAPMASALLQEQGIDPPYEVKEVPVSMATIHSLEEARQRREEAAAAAREAAQAAATLSERFM